MKFKRKWNLFECTIRGMIFCSTARALMSSRNSSSKGSVSAFLRRLYAQPSKTLTSIHPANDVVPDGVSALSRQIGVITIPGYCRLPIFVSIVHSGLAATIDIIFFGVITGKAAAVISPSFLFRPRRHKRRVSVPRRRHIRTKGAEDN